MSSDRFSARRTGRVRRVVTGNDGTGKSYIVTDGEAPHVFASKYVDGFGAAHVWYTEAGPVDNSGEFDPAGSNSAMPTFPDVGETIFRIADFPPDSTYSEAGKAALFTEIGADHEREAAEHSESKHFWFHKTDSIDYAIVLEGEIWLLLDEDECLLRAGDVVIQRGTSHAWANRSENHCRMAFVLLGAPPVPLVEGAESVGRRA